MNMTKNTLTVLLLFFAAANVFPQASDKKLFEENPPHKVPAILLSSMPCFIGLANQYGDYLGISEGTLKKVKGFISEAQAKVPGFKKQIRELEMSLMMASKEERYGDYEKLLQGLGTLKTEASLFHEELVKRARRVFDKRDVEKLDAFIMANQEVFLGASKL